MSGTPPERHRSMARGILSFGGMTMLSRVFGLVRDRLIGHYFGANAMTDAFFVAFRIPNFMRRLFAEGSFSTAFVPVFTEIKEKRSHAELKELMARTAGTLGGVLLLVTAAGMLAAPWLAALFSNHAEPIPGQQDLIARLLLLTFPFLLCVSLTALAAGALNSYQRFGLPAFTPIILNLCMIAGSIWGSRLADPPIMALGWAVLAGGLAQLLYQLPHLKKIGMLVLPRLNLRDTGVWRVLKQMGPAILGVSVSQISLIINTIFASFLAAGSVSWMYYADRLMELPSGVLGVALGTILLPSLAKTYASDDRHEYSRLMDWGLRLCFLLVLPCALALALIAEPLTVSLFQYGKFSANDALMTQRALIAYAVGLLGIILVKVLAPGFYARQNIRTPVKIALFTLVSTQAMNLVFIGPLKHAGLALAISLAACLNAGLLYWQLRKHDLFEPQPGWAKFLGKLVLAVLVMSAVLLGLMHFMPAWDLGGMPLRLARLGVLVVAGVVAYFGMLALLGFRLRDFSRRAVS